MLTRLCWWPVAVAVAVAVNDPVNVSDERAAF